MAYSSRLLSRTEQAYCTTRKELLAVVHALKSWKTYLLGRKVILRTDHSALLYLRRTPEPISQQARWLNLFGMFDLELQHRNADSLSRRPCDENKLCRQCNDKKTRTGKKTNKTADHGPWPLTGNTYIHTYIHTYIKGTYIQQIILRSESLCGCSLLKQVSLQMFLKCRK